MGKNRKPSIRLLTESSDWRGNIYALEGHTKIFFFSNSSRLNMLEKETTLLYDMGTRIQLWPEDSFDGSGRKSSVL